MSVHKYNSDQLSEGDFEPLSSASSMDTLVEKSMEMVEEESATLKKSSRNLRKNRRRNERFATNLRNEIQRKKAQLQSSRGPGGLLCSGETVHEEGPDFHEDGELEVPERNAKVGFAQPNTTTEDLKTVEGAPVDSNCDVSPIQPNANRSVQVVDPGVPSFGVGIRVVEEPAPAGKARRWRWTPEHKLQPENEPQTKRSGDKLFGVASSRHGVCAFTSSSTSTYPRSMSCSRMDESDLLPFADRMKFFEETSKTGVAKAPPSQAKLRSYQLENQAGDVGFQPQRRYSYQGGYRQEGSSLTEARRQSVERLRQREMERQARELEFEKARQREKEQEERMRQWERDREIERREELDRIREMDRLKREKEERQEYFARSQEIHQSYHQHRDDFSGFQPSVHGFEQSQVSRSAFYPVNGPSQHFDNQQHQGFSARSHTPTEMYPARQQETTKLNRKYSLTERDYSSRRWEPRAVDPSQCHQSRWTHRQHDHAHSNGYGLAPPPAPLRARAMSENDLHFDTTHRWSPSLSVASSQTLSEVEEGPSDGATQKPLKKKMPPPPRPPPPKWEQFHKRRASHHAVYSSSVPQSVTADYSGQSSYEPEMSRQRSYSLPPQRQDLSTTAAACPKCSCHQNPPQDLPAPQTPPHNHQPPPYDAQRYSHVPANQIQPPSVSLSNKVPAFQTQQSHISSNEIQPPTNPIPTVQPSVQSSSQVPPPPLLSSNQLPVFSIAPPSPMFSRRAFRPVAPPQRNSRGSVGEEAEEFPPPPPPVADDLDDGSDSEISHIQDRDQVIKAQSIPRHTVEWERTQTVSPSPPPPPLPPSPPAPVVPNSDPEPFHSIDFQENHQPKSEFETSDNMNEEKSVDIDVSETTLSPSPSQSLEADLDVPLETDIDDFPEEELPVANVQINSELPCLALPVTVLETDLDLLPDPESSPSGKTRPESSLMGEEELEVQEGSLEEIFPQSSEGESGTESWRGASQSTEHNTDSLDRRSGASSSCSSYYSTSTAKAQLLTQMKDFTENRDSADHDELTYKRTLMESLRKKLGVLREAQRGLQEDIRANAQLGEEVEAMVVSVCKPNEVDKFRMFIGDLDKVVSLMLSLSGRLLRVETTLDTLDSEADHEERLPLQEKKRQLMRQLSEAQDLKEHVDRREQAVSRVLGRCLSPEQHRDYSHFVKMKAALLVEQRQLEDKIRLGEEQLRGLRESLGLGLGVGMGLAMGYGQY